MDEIWSFVAERDGRFLGACVASLGRREVRKWSADMVEAGGTVKPVKNRDEYNAWLATLKD